MEVPDKCGEIINGEKIVLTADNSPPLIPGIAMPAFYSCIQR